MKALTYILAACIAATTFCRCSSDEPNDSMTLYDIVTFERNTPSAAVFSFQKNGDSPLIELTVPERNISDEHVRPGCRLLMAYVPESGQPHTSGNVTLRGLARINFDSISTGPVTGWNADPVYMYSMWRTGEFINMECRLDYSTQKRRFSLVADESTLDHDIPQLYVVHDMGSQPDNFTRRIYASWNIADVWNRPGCRGVTVHINDSNRNMETITFNKENQ